MAPQHHTEPFTRRAQLCSLPSASFTIDVPLAPPEPELLLVAPPAVLELTVVEVVVPPALVLAPPAPLADVPVQTHGSNPDPSGLQACEPICALGHVHETCWPGTQVLAPPLAAVLPPAPKVETLDEQPKSAAIAAGARGQVLIGTTYRCRSAAATPSVRECP